MFSEKDLQQIAEHGLTTAIIEEQIENFKNGFPFLGLEKAATIGDGIIRADQETVKRYVAKFDAFGGKKLKFVPASGAASRMFKALFSFAEKFDGSESAIEKLNADKGFQSVYNFIDSLEKFAFYPALEKHFASKGENLAELKKAKHYGEIVNGLLEEDGLNYGGLPKGLLAFHSYANAAPRTPVEEHMVEGANYSKNSDGSVNLHFTVSPEHESGFKALIAEKQAEYEAKFGVNYHITFSQQKKSTDTIAVDLENAPFRNQDDTLLFRPAGHGALLANLNDLDADVVFIKNIDNVVPDRMKETTFTYKKVLAGALLEVQTRIFNYQKMLEDSPSKEKIVAIEDFLETKLCTAAPKGYSEYTHEERIEYLSQKLNRPIRACGMVINEGEPGGGPFWARNQDGSVSLQIAETAQIDTADSEQKEILSGSTHFNPVDLVCSMKNFKGEKFDLMKFRDPSTGFISEKSKDGKDLKAQELPGLWNGAMSDWNTIFVEVPIETFNPVKTVNDLLRDQHQ